MVKLTKHTYETKDKQLQSIYFEKNILTHKNVERNGITAECDLN